MKHQGAFSRIVGFVGKCFLFSPPPPPSTFFVCFCSNFRAITRLERLATQATSDFVTSAFCVPTHKNPQRHKIIYGMRPTQRTIYQFEAFHSVMRIPLLKFSKIPLAFLVGISQPLSNLHSVCNLFVTMHL